MRYHRRSIRLKGYDYSRPGAYFVTICVQGGAFLLGEVTDGCMGLNNAGLLVQECWEWLEQQHGNVRLDKYVVMPNHLHGIIIVTDTVEADDACRGGSRTAPTTVSGHVQAKRKPLGRLIGAFKTVSTKRLNQLRGGPGERIWQRGFFEHVIRNDNSLERIREYILGNPGRWELDNENPRQTEADDFDEWLRFQGRQ
jgi:putative transposase